ncbi:C1 family peptidase [Methanogenium cariaci]|uniref:C1 family peptidase n=1 Tax=Methanogenium cariaci TaxID=2197 RepID=UPI0007834E42|nr:C1 family peptidase [Methanogenium cariaci]
MAYTEGMDAGVTDQISSESYAYAELTEETDAPYATGLLPSPALAFWPDGYTAEAVTNGSALPARFDLRDEGRATPARDQGKAGSCWAFATYGSLESTYLTDSGDAMNFSENNMKNLCSDEYPNGFDRTPYDGGFAFMSNAYLVRGSGPVMEADDPYALPYPSNISPPPILHQSLTCVRSPSSPPGQAHSTMISIKRLSWMKVPFGFHSL